MRISAWSSDVCSSDLRVGPCTGFGQGGVGAEFVKQGARAIEREAAVAERYRAHGECAGQGNFGGAAHALQEAGEGSVDFAQWRDGRPAGELDEGFGGGHGVAAPGTEVRGDVVLPRRGEKPSPPNPPLRSEEHTPELPTLM